MFYSEANYVKFNVHLYISSQTTPVSVVEDDDTKIQND